MPVPVPARQVVDLSSDDEAPVVTRACFVLPPLSALSHINVLLCSRTCRSCRVPACRHPQRDHPLQQRHVASVLPFSLLFRSLLAHSRFRTTRRRQPVLPRRPRWRWSPSPAAPSPARRRWPRQALVCCRAVCVVCFCAEHESGFRLSQIVQPRTAEELEANNKASFLVRIFACVSLAAFASSPPCNQPDLLTNVPLFAPSCFSCFPSHIRLRSVRAAWTTLR